MTSPLNPAALPDTTPPFWTDTLVADTVEAYYGFGTYSFSELPFAGSDVVLFLPDTVGWAQIDNTQTA